MTTLKKVEPAVTTVSCALMVMVAGGCLLAIFGIKGLPNYTSALHPYLGTLAVITTLAVASNLAVYGVRDIGAQSLSGVDGLCKALTRCAAPFAVVVVAVAVSDGLTLWQFAGFIPLTAPLWTELIRRCL